LKNTFFVQIAGVFLTKNGVFDSKMRVGNLFFALKAVIVHLFFVFSDIFRVKMPSESAFWGSFSHFTPPTFERFSEAPRPSLRKRLPEQP